MAFERVDVVRLRTALNNCVSSLSKQEEQQITNSCVNAQVWQSTSRDHWKQAMEQLTNVDYVAIEEELKKGFRVADLIEKYQQYQESVREMEERVERLLDREDPPRSRIRELRRKIRTYEDQMELWRKQVNEIVS